tara:strand:+ start:641 stop:1036 length:396 start_codon:yes stop_codon:yes gene_type:complete
MNHLRGDSYINKNFNGYDLALFQNWNKLEHGELPDNLKRYKKLIEKLNLLYYSYNNEDNIPYLNLTDFLCMDKWNKLRKKNNNSYEKYRLKNGLVYKFMWNDMCFCIDKTYLIVKIQRKFRSRKPNVEKLI